MTIPYNINLLKFIAACFGVQLQGSDDREQMESMLITIADLLGFSSEETMAFWSMHQGQIVELATATFSTPSNLLMLDDSVADGTSALFGWLERNKERVQQYAERFGLILEARSLIPIRSLGPLAAFVALTWIVRRFSPAYNQLIIREAQLLLLTLLLTRTRETQRALSLWKPFPSDFEPAGRKALQTQGEIAYHATNRLAEGPPDPNNRGAVREFRKNMLDAWLLAYETSMFHICKFFWLVKRKLKKGDDPKDDLGLADMPYEKGVVYNEVMDWCNANGFSFPFYERGVKLRNNKAHGSCLLNDERGTVVFLDRAEQPIGELPQEEVVQAALHDVAMASHFFEALPLAIMDYDNRMGRLDGPWRAFKRRVSDLRSVLDLEIDGSDILGGPAATREQVVDYLLTLQPLEFVKLMEDLRDVWECA